jgi:uncharacterized protein
MYPDDPLPEEPFFLGDWFPPDHPDEINKQLIEAIKEANVNRVLELLSKEAEPNAHYEDVPLLMAIQYGQTEIVKVLLEAGADPNYEDEDQYTMLMFAASAGYLEIVRILVNKGACVSVIGKGSSALSIAVQAGHQEIVEYLSPLTSEEDRRHADLHKNLH